MARTSKSQPVANGSSRELRQHSRNANRGTLRGSCQLEESIKRFGFTRSIVVDQNGEAIAGNHVLEKAQERNAKTVVVETTGDTLVVVKRTDMDLNDPDDKRAIEAAIADNQISHVGLDWDSERLAEALEGGAKLEAFFLDDELQKALKADENAMKDEEKKGPGMQTVVKLQFLPGPFNEFNAMVVRLSEQWNLSDPANVVLEALRKVSA